MTITTVSPALSVRVSPAAAFALHSAAEIVSDDLRCAAKALADGSSFQELLLDAILPDCFASRYTPEMLAQLADETMTVSEKLIAAGPHAEMRNSAQILMGHHIIDTAMIIDELMDLGDQPGDPTPQQFALAVSEIQDLDDLAFPDQDITMLLDPRLAALVGSQVAAEMGMRNLHIDDWFAPFEA